MDDKNVGELAEAAKMKRIIYGRIEKQMEDGHWLPSWKLTVNKLLSESFVSARKVVGEYGHQYYLFQLNFPLLDGKTFAVDVVTLGSPAEDKYAKEVVELPSRLKTTEMQQLPPNLWATIVSLIHDTGHGSYSQLAIQRAFRQHLVINPNWIRIRPELFHPNVPLFVKGKKVNIVATDGNRVVGVNEQQRWVKHFIAPSSGFDRWRNPRIGVKINWNGEFASGFENPRTITAFEEQIIRIIRLCFRHDRIKCLAAEKLCKLIISQAGKFHPTNSNSNSNFFVILDPINSTDPEILQYNVRQLMWKYASTTKQSMIPFLVCELERLITTKQSCASVARKVVADVIDILTPEEVGDIILLLSDITFNVRKRRTDTGHYGWMVAAVKVACRIEAYEKYLGNLMIQLGNNGSNDACNDSNTSNSLGVSTSINLIKDLTNIIGEYSLLSQLPDNLRQTVNEQDWNGKDD